MQTNPLRPDAAEDPRTDAIFRVIQGHVNWENIVPTLMEAASEVEAMPGLKGREKLELLQEALRHAVKVSGKPAEEKEQLLHTIETVVPIVMQGIILASKTPIMSAVVRQVCVGCWTKK